MTGEHERRTQSAAKLTGNAVSSQAILRQSIIDGIEAARRNRLAGIALWIFGSAIITGYWFIPSVHRFLETIAQLKIRGGFWFAAVSTGLFGGLIPSLLRKCIDAKLKNPPNTWLISNSLFWAAKGVEIDVWYRLQAYLFGDGSSWQVIAIKTVVDQLVYVPVLGLVNVILFFAWRDCGYSVSRFRQQLGPHWYRKRVLPVLIANWLVWFPAVILIYCFPLALQLPIQNLVLCFWILLLTFLTALPDGIRSAGVR